MPFSVNTPDKVIYFILPTRRSHYLCTKTNICLIMKDEYDAPLTNALAKNVDSKGLEGYLWRCEMISLCVKKQSGGN